MAEARTSRSWYRWLGVTLVAFLAAAMTVLASGPARAADGDITIKVHVGGDRTAATTVSQLAGVEVGLFSGGTPVAEPWATATTGADGVATFTVPADRAGSRLTMRATAAPNGYGAIGRIYNETYEFQTPVLQAGGSYEQYSLRGRELELATLRDNPAMPAKCGLDVALVMDVSGSVSGYENQLRAAGKAYVDALLGTPSQVQLFTFSTKAEVASGLTSVSSQAGADALNATIGSLTAFGSTNWDDALWTVAEQSTKFDVAVVVTDGMPNAVEPAVFSANALKAEGTRVVTMGVGSGVNSPSAALNLAAISGPTKYDGSNVVTADYYQTDTYDEVAQALREMVFASCAPSLTVVKQVLPDGSDEAAPAGGWAFDATTTSSITLAPSGTTDAATGAVNFPVSFAGAIADAQITITEQQQPGYTLIQQKGANAVCTAKNTANPLGRPLDVTNVADGFTLTMSPGDMVSCTVTSQAPAKGWVPTTPTPTPTDTGTPTASPTPTPSGPSSPLASTGANVAVVGGIVAVVVIAGLALTIVARRR
ncbi:MAG: VWA domain-containing protein, partial [Cellulomonas sp.]|nr:VWA domain-containing protein [Cellulomonas sp.]